jgi:quinohemoprotein ethanol dehydrogenase
VTADAAAINEGRVLYTNRCGACHGFGARSANVIPDLRYLTPEKHAQFAGYVYGMSADKGMPNFVGIVAPEEVEKIHQYVIQRAHDLKAELAQRDAPKP